MKKLIDIINRIKVRRISARCPQLDKDDVEFICYGAYYKKYKKFSRKRW